MAEDEKILQIKILLEHKRTLRTIEEATSPLFEEVRKGIKEAKDIKLIHGIDGKDGHDGKDGTDGIKGESGQDGIDGKNGKDGKNGLNGKDGKDGKDGQDGRNGKDGQDGLNATGIDKTEIIGDDLYITFTDSKRVNIGRVKGQAGKSSNGRSAFFYATAGGYTGTEAEFSTLMANQLTVLSGEEEPPNTLGKDGDIYFKI